MNPLETRIYYSEAIPRERVYLMPDPAFDIGPILFRRDPWGPPTYPLAEEYRPQRDRGLGYVADLLDGLCERWGLDPETVWREPKWREQSRWNEMSFMVTERLALSVLRPGAAFKVVTS